MSELPVSTSGLPPVRSEHTAVALTRDVLSIAPWRTWIEHPDVGAHAWFEGVTRRMTGQQETIRLEYEAYETMAYSELGSLAKDVSERFSLHRLVVVHRLGIVPVGETSLLVGCSAPHRLNVFRALSEVVDLIKRDVPIWKREHFADGNCSWVHPS